jgi:hypothetical protein
MILERLLHKIALEPYVENTFSETERIYLDLLQKVRYEDFNKYIKYYHKFEEVRNRKIDNYLSSLSDD